MSTRATPSSAPSPWRDPVILLAVPAVLYLLVVYAYPLLWLLMKSFTGPSGLTIQPYISFMSDPFNWRVVGNTLRVAAWVTLFCFVVGYPAAFALARAGTVVQIVMLVSIILPLSIGAVVKAFAWQIVLRRDGVVSQLLVGLGIWDEPQRLLFTETGLVLGAANIFLPFMILPIYSVVKLIDPRLSEAGATLGATPLYSFTRVTLPLTVSTCGMAAQLSPWLVEDAVKRGHEIACHGWRWEKHAHMEEAAEREAIAKTVKVLTEIAGTRPVGWHTRSTPSPNTRRLLIEEGGFLYDSDDYSDDLPFFVAESGKNHLVIPYSFDTNDMHYHQGFHRFVTARDFADYTTDAFDTLWAEGERSPKMMSIGLHLRMIGRPGRIAALDRIIGHMKQKGGAWFATRRQIAEHWIKL